MAIKGFNNITEDLKNQVNKAIEIYTSRYGGGDKEFLDFVTSTFLMQEAKQLSPEFQKDIEELELHVRRIIDLVLNVVDRSKFEKEDIVRKADEDREKKNLIIEKLNFDLTETEKRIHSLEEENGRISEDNLELKRNYSQLEESIETERRLNRELQDKIGKLGETVAEYREGYEKANELRKIVHDFQAENERLKLSIQEQQQKIEDIQEQHANEFRISQERQKDELARQAERLELAKERELLAIRSELQQQAQEAAQVSTNEIRKLYERIDQMRSEHEKQLTALRDPKPPARSKGKDGSTGNEGVKDK